MSSKIGLTIGTRVVHVHALIDATWNKTASQPAAKKSNQKSGNVGNQTGGSCGLGDNLGMATGADHVRGSRSNRDDCGYDGGATVLL